MYIFALFMFLFCNVNVSVAVSPIVLPSNGSTTSSDPSSALQIAFGSASSNGPPINSKANNSSLMDDSPIKISCFKQPPPPAPPTYMPVRMSDYCKAIQQILLRPDFTETQIWELSDDPETWNGWKVNNFGIFLGGNSPTVEAFAPAFVAHVAAVLAAECLDITKGCLGGTASAGPSGDIFVGLGENGLLPP